MGNLILEILPRKSSEACHDPHRKFITSIKKNLTVVGFDKLRVGVSILVFSLLQLLSNPLAMIKQLKFSQTYI